ncbi:MAG: hypothetical protein JXE06_08890 [Coriobacteriia bacterium]|nr:hypothetical protein [Coriobacteriia bacterium]MBN2822417.1 hypothetical protein [Coriobacteriia bacterium]
MGPYVHFRLTYDWAVETGFSAEEADRIGRADVGVDVEFPARASVAAASRHFAPTAWVWGAVYKRRAERDCDLEALGRALHCFQDVYAHGWLGLAHLRFDLKIARDPDDWDRTPLWERRRIERISRRTLASYLTVCTGGVRRR